MADSPQRRRTGSQRTSSSKTQPTRATATADNTPANTTAATETDQWMAEVDELSFQEARTALELTLAQLQAETLEVEDMAGLYRRAKAYAKRCEAVLKQVEQDVIQWDDEGAPQPV